MKVRDVLREKKGGRVIQVPATETVATAVQLLVDHTIGGLPVVDEDGRAVGFVSEREIVRVVHERWEGMRERRVEEVMVRPAPVCRIDDPLPEVMARMTRQRLRHLVVVEGEAISAIISIGDIVKHRIRELETEAGVLRDYVAGQRARG